MEFSILIPSRNRPDQLKQLIESIISKTAYIEEIEILVAIDLDEPQKTKYTDLRDYAIDQGLNFKLMGRQRIDLHPDYYNTLAQESTGSNLWALCDDCIIETEKWDAVAFKLIKFWKHEQASKNQNFKIYYGDVGDSTRNYNNNGAFSCFPMLSRPAYEILGYIFNPRIKAWGTDKFLKHVFTQSNAGIISMLNVYVQHAHLQNDETHEVLINRLKSFAGQECSLDYSEDIARLKKGMMIV